MKTMKMAQNSGMNAEMKGNNGSAAENNALLQQGEGDCLLPIGDDAVLELGEAEIAGLVYMIEEEKMAMDLYDSFAEQTGSAIFDKISDSELRHMSSLIQVAEAADVDLSFLSSEAGVFSDARIQQLYDSLLDQGSESFADAIDVGILVEMADIEDLQSYTNGDEVGLLGGVYAKLEAGSEHHLAAFTQYDAVVAEA